MPQSGLRSSIARTPRAGRTRSSASSTSCSFSFSSCRRRWPPVGCCGSIAPVAHAVAGVFCDGALHRGHVWPWRATWPCAGWPRRRLSSQRLRWALLHDVSSILRFHRSRSLATGHVLHSPDHPHHAIVHLPGNESLELDLTERGLDVPRLPPALEGLSIVHLSDFHFTGKVGKPFFEEIVRMSNALEPEIVALTGDLVDKTQCIDWIPDTLGRLKARYGVYYIFGNHDLRVDCAAAAAGDGRLRAGLPGRPLEGDRGPRPAACSWPATSCLGSSRPPT